MIDYSEFFERIAENQLIKLGPELVEVLESKFGSRVHSSFSAWLDIIESFPEISPSIIDFNQDVVTIGQPNDITQAQQEQIKQGLMNFKPWRKGPFRLFGIDIDTEWRSNMKWHRVAKVISPLKGRVVLDVGCGNGYYGWKMLGEGARFVVGIDPSWQSLTQHLALSKFIEKPDFFLLPLTLEQFPKRFPLFDTVFSMGVLYHRRSPLDHILDLASLLHKGGELVLETIVVDGEEGYSLLPSGRYAKMNNVWFLPSCATLKCWMERCGFADVKIADISTTLLEEQRATEWMSFESLEDYLDSDDRSITVEGYPAPKRAILTGIKN
ncbi:MAG: tRNA 5-methoxyuridine(34)/uridine 5-oxyacetic acid(34) synthase CmoB [Gammaproteobacteria bacterium]|nr:MAG: tRNA 5-methoxyuridine(34)/uridine 5-oxyacetic acid(34) synthase CmoB [Gammaproteobacteria bacterium]